MTQQDKPTGTGEQTSVQVADAASPTALDDATLENASGGIIAILIGQATQPKPEPKALADGSVRSVSSHLSSNS